MQLPSALASMLPMTGTSCILELWCELHEILLEIDRSTSACFLFLTRILFILFLFQKGAWLFPLMLLSCINNTILNSFTNIYLYIYIYLFILKYMIRFLSLYYFISFYFMLSFSCYNFNFLINVRNHVRNHIVIIVYSLHLFSHLSLVYFMCIQSHAIQVYTFLHSLCYSWFYNWISIFSLFVDNETLVSYWNKIT